VGWIVITIAKAQCSLGDELPGLNVIAYSYLDDDVVVRKLSALGGWRLFSIFVWVLGWLLLSGVGACTQNPMGNLLALQLGWSFIIHCIREPIGGLWYWLCFFP
jgi:hypothetical protein